ncbi:hypothetical protein HKX48_000814 [Thoreauomyces humboldtii]|nr:hypothetical protein HKX48_000814 [Thoreauomyces humboldtii]
MTDLQQAADLSPEASFASDRAPSVTYELAREFEYSTEISSVFFDSDGQSVVLIEEDQEIILPNDSSETKRIYVGRKGAIRDAKLAPNGLFLGVLRSAKMLEILAVDADTGAQTLQEIIRDSRSSDAILGFEWTFPGELLVVNGTGLELYQPDIHILVASVGPLALKVFHLKSETADQVMAINLSPAGKVEAMQRQATRKQITVLHAYGRLFCGFFDLTPEPPLLVLHRISRTAPSQRISYKLDARGTFSQNVVDNLIVVHNTVTKHVMIFDLKSGGTDPVVPKNRICLPGDEELESVGEWQPFSPDFLLSTTRGALLRILPDVASIVRDMRVKMADFDVLRFLMRREIEDPQLILQIVLEMMQDGKDVGEMRKVFDLLNATGRRVEA